MSKINKKEVKTPILKKEPNIKIGKAIRSIKKVPEVELVSFSVRATIPVMTFGNIQPEIVCKASTIEEAQAYALPIIENLFNKYVEAPRDGSSKPSFISKANITVEEKVITPKATSTEPVKPLTNVTSSNNESEPITDFSEAYQKALKSIQIVTSKAALDLIEEKIKNSVKIAPSEKPMLFVVLLKKQKEFN